MSRRPRCRATWRNWVRSGCEGPRARWCTRCRATPAARDRGPAASALPAPRGRQPARDRPPGPAAGHGGRGGAAGEPAAFGALPRVAAELLVSAEASANLVVLRTPAGGAQLLASALDHAAWPAILGTVAGDDTVLVITRDPAGGAEVAVALLRQAERKAAEERRS